ncbi:hypothetical protein [Streptomyces sp. NTK 937]|uniref:hypothetical protein n=1 Tax=Streptomyces sp. NTK 937 TaxID=1487711 RepID=UPI0004A98DA7|nr:hypothetical protein [Streptomyces sp. NTK 937]KDQ65747.1 hypothetical protein DT87_00380 [Streptomyces sp. NTK 937]
MSSELARPDKGTVAHGDDIPTLELDDISNESAASLVARGAAYAREYESIQGKATTLLKNLAVTQVALRIKYDDMRGRSGQYRSVVAGMYRGMNIPEDRLQDMQAAVRWHIGNILRRHLTPRQLEAEGLQPTSPLERGQDKRKAVAAIVQAVRATEAVEESTPRPAKRATKNAPAVPADKGQPVRATSDHLRLAEVAGNILDKFDRSVIKSHMTDGQRAKLDAELAAMEKKIANLRKLTQKPRSGR